VRSRSGSTTTKRKATDNIGSMGRIPVGTLTDQFGGRVMFPIVSAGHHRAGALPRPGRPAPVC